MNTSVGFGLMCPNGHGSVQVMVNAGSSAPPRCPVCRALMIANPNASPVSANRTCGSCGGMFGMVSGDNGRCPACHKPW